MVTHGESNAGSHPCSWRTLESSEAEKHHRQNKIICLLTLFVPTSVLKKGEKKFNEQILVCFIPRYAGRTGSLQAGNNIINQRLISYKYIQLVILTVLWEEI